MANGTGLDRFPGGRPDGYNKVSRTVSIENHSDSLRDFVKKNLKLVDGKWQWSTRVLEKAEEFAHQVYGNIPPCSDCQGFGSYKTGAVKFSQLGNNWSARHHLVCKTCKGAGKVLPDVLRSGL